MSYRQFGADTAHLLVDFGDEMVLVRAVSEFPDYLGIMLSRNMAMDLGRRLVAWAEGHR